MSSTDKQRTVIKLGTGILTFGIGRLDTLRINSICTEVAKLKDAGQEVVLVSSGAVGLGMGRLGLSARPTRLSSLQKCAAVGQSILTETWQAGFHHHDIIVAQILVTRNDLNSVNRRKAIFNLINSLLADGIVPIINENDSVSFEEIKFGDNDGLSALVAKIIRANTLIIMSTIPGLMDLEKDLLITRVNELTPEIEALAGGTSSKTAVGGMVSKLMAAKVCLETSIDMFICSGNDPSILGEYFAGTATGTLFKK